MKCADIMIKNLELLTEQDSVLRAATVMAEAGIGFLPICDATGRAIGVVTDRDLTTRGMAKKIDPATTSATLVMTSPAVTCIETADIDDAEDLMATERKSRLVITDEAGKVVGVLSLADLVENAPGGKTLDTVRAVLRREALGPRGGAARGQTLLKDDPIAQNLVPPSDDINVKPSVFIGGQRQTDTKEFPG